MKKNCCDQCGAKLPIGVRFKNRFTREGWHYLRFCSMLCEENNELEHARANRQTRWLAYLGR